MQYRMISIVPSKSEKTFFIGRNSQIEVKALTSNAKRQSVKGLRLNFNRIRLYKIIVMEKGLGD